MCVLSCQCFGLISNMSAKVLAVPLPAIVLLVCIDGIVYTSPMRVGGGGGCAHSHHGLASDPMECARNGRTPLVPGDAKHCQYRAVQVDNK